MTFHFKVFKGSESKTVVESSGQREVGPTEALVEISHAGVCGTDLHYCHAPMGLGHEGVGVIKELGREASRISDLKVGDRVGMGWRQKVCGFCKSCLRGNDSYCLNDVAYGTGNTDQGCWGTAVSWDVSTLVKIPDTMDSAEAAPLMCAGATVWAPLYQEGVRATDRIGVVGLGGLGHLAVQFARKMGLEVVVFSSTESKKEEATRFGATEFYATHGLTKLDGIQPIDYLLVTSSVQPDIALYQTVMAKNGKIFPLTVSFEATPVPLLPLITHGLRIVGSGGCNRESLSAMLQFAAQHGVRPQIQRFPMTVEGITQAMETLQEGKMRYRGVIETTAQ